MAAAVTGVLARQLPKRYRVYSSDLRVRVLATGLATYPDVTVVCGPSVRDPESMTHVTNPMLVVEILSRSTAEYDRGEKLFHYQQIPSLASVVLVDRDSYRIEAWTRSPAGGWDMVRYQPGDIVPLEPIGCSLPVDDVFAAAAEA
jgi:Uma2 family endonuclease